MSDASNQFRRRACAGALLLAPGLTLLGHLVQASPAAHDTASELASVAAHPGRATLSALVGFVALSLMIPALFGLARPLLDSRPRVALTGLGLSVTGVLGLVALMGSAPVTIAMANADADRGQMIALSDRYESSALVGLWAALMLLGYTLGPVVLAVALWRSGGSWLIPAAMVGGVVLMMADAGRYPLAAGFACTWLGLATAGVSLLREPTTGRRNPVSVPS